MGEKNQTPLRRNNNVRKEKEKEEEWESEEEEVVAEDGGWDSDESDGGKEELGQDLVSDLGAPHSSGALRSTRKAKTLAQARLLGVLVTNAGEASLPQKRKQALPKYENGSKATKKARGNNENL